MCKLSIIVPIYNVEQFLKKCVDSIIRQSFMDFELILVDDGSPDNCPTICDEYKKNDTRVKVIHKENGGLISAWKEGVLNAAGEYIGFVDSDDWVEDDMYHNLIRIADETNADIITSGFYFEYLDKTVASDEVLENGYYDKRQIEKEILPFLFASKKYKGRVLSPNRWNKLYRRNILLNVLNHINNDITIGEDLITTFLFLNECNSLYVDSNIHSYHYRINSSSMTQTFNPVKYKKILLLRNSLLDINDYLKINFSEQIYSDYTDLLLRVVETEILTKKNSTIAEITNSIRKHFENPDFENVKRNFNLHFFPLKVRVYLFLIKNKFWWMLIMIRRMKG